ncbi:UDP-4-amino-4,6-dideoxy-N-acetyl-beta-L-altrosamine transaminase [Aestuariibacter sp. A3R04]|uniref:UDP-4-amino-4, 6-dideoxy-N-acetyl-beta-L-altrosamine transaminase n=1 Tax=Aestuariibacter sp. A3R04 TaxID=2841571 RepID=UPI001C08178F|nr:UDP-4-amino-4,6-dideoxy-N-acetyl-beta-L-altrosamine transaminase [Aestuariibacter sp. A3R04]MBU3022172.1 UDP-4-amino-4,6-dideoxy-N-acetyl-beta-L-altrosamine transaminase [Aestuariibacter sp. A3R04]
MIPYGKHSVSDEDVEAVVHVLKNEFLTQGKQVPAFERALCDYTGAGYAVACNSGTSGLHMACLAAGVGAGDVVWTVPNSFAASANAALYCGAAVDFVDIDPVTRNLCVSALSNKLNDATAAGRLPKAIVVVHFAGSSCDMRAIAALTAPLGITLIEDAAHAFGGKDKLGNRVGACTYSAMVVSSFHPVKSITTAEGGVVFTNDGTLAEKLRLFASHGITKQQAKMPVGHEHESWFYAQIDLGFNYRLSDLHAALGLVQLAKLDAFVGARFEKAKYYNEALAALPVTRPLMDENSAWHLYVIELPEHDRTQVFKALREKGIGVNVHYIPIHLHPYYQGMGFAKGDFPNSETYYQKAITLPLYPDLSADNQGKVINSLKEALM